MPATGLPDVKQKAIFDASGYVKGSDETVVAALKMRDANREVIDSLNDFDQMRFKVVAGLAGVQSEFQRFISVQKDFDTLGASVQKYASQIQKLREVQEWAAEESRQQAEERKAAHEEMLWQSAQQVEAQRLALAQQATAQAQYNARMIQMANDHITAQRALAAEIEKTGRAHETNIVMKAPGMVRSMNTIQTKAEALNKTLESVRAGITDIAAAKGDKTIAAVFGDTSSPFAIFGGTGKGAPEKGMSAPELVAAAAAAAASTSRPDPGASGFSAAVVSMLRAHDESKRYSSVVPTLLAGGGVAAIMTLLGSPGMRGAIVGAARAAGGAVAAAGGAAGGILGPIAAAAGGGGAFGMGRAATESAAVGAFIGRWYPAAHWAMMLTNELLATVGPATVAAGMGGLVGMQGAEQVIPRAQAIFNTAESLGGSLGITAGQAAGLTNSPLQTAQNLATGGAFELTGAGINAMKAGAGNAFIQLGTNTVAMFDRFAATMTQEFQHGLGKQLGSIVSGGTGYLQQIGDVAANLGDVFLHVAPNLPGVGGDLLSTLSGGLGGLSHLTSFLGASLGPILSFEAGARWGPTLVGGTARGLSRISGGALGTVARTATAADVGVVFNPATGGLVAAEGEMIAGTGAAGALGGMGAIGIGAAAAGAFTLSKAITWKDKAQLAADATMQNISQMGFAQGVPSIFSAMQAAAKVPDTSAGGMTAGQRFQQGSRNALSGLFLHADPGAFFRGTTEAISGFGGSFAQAVGLGGGTPSNFQVAQQALQGLSSAMVNSLGAGQQVATEWKGVTGSTLDMGKAYDVATMAQLQLGSAFEKNGKLTSQAKTMIDNLQAGYQAMNFTGVHGSKMFGAAVGAQTAMAGLQHSQVAAVNSSYDQLLQLVTGGAAGSSGFFSTLAGTQTTSKHGGIQFIAPPGYKSFAQALTSFTSPGGSAAWNVLTNSTNGLIPQMGNQTDWLRNMQTMGALSPGQTTQMAAFQMQQLLPMARKSPAALAMLSTIGQEFGGPAMTGNQEQDFKNIAGWTNKFAENAKAYNKNMNEGTVAASNIPRDAQQFSQQIGSGIVGGLAQGITAHGADLQNRFMDSMLGSGGKTVNAGALKNYATFLANSGVPKAAGMDMSQQVAKLSGAGSNTAIQSAIKAAVTQAYAQVKVTADVSPAQAALRSLSNKQIKAQVDVSGISQVKTLQNAIDTLKSKTVQAAAKAEGAGAVAALNAEIAALHSKEVTITTRMITVGGLPGVTPGIPVGVVNPHFNPGAGLGFQTGMKIPGYGGGDIFPAMLEPGELVVPKHLVGSVAPILGGKIPGFADGGGFGVMGFETMLQEAFHGDAVQDTMRQIMDGIFGNEIQKFPRGLQFSPNITITNPAGGPRGGTPVRDPLGGLPNPLVHPGVPEAHAVGVTFSVEVLKGLIDGIKNAKGAAKTAATAMMNHISQELQYAKNTASSLTQGLNFGGMNVDPATGNGPVQTQMQSYASSLKAFSADIKSMSKAGLNKDLLRQMIAAGPVQGDALAQSIQQGPGGVKAVNQLYSSIQKMSRGIAAQGASALYGGHLNQDLKSGTFVNNNVSIHISMSGGGGGDLSTLSTKELNQLVAKIQAALLKQAKRNRKTGVALKGKQA